LPLQTGAHCPCRLFEVLLFRSSFYSTWLSTLYFLRIRRYGLLSLFFHSRNARKQSSDTGTGLQAGNATHCWLDGWHGMMRLDDYTVAALYYRPLALVFHAGRSMHHCHTDASRRPTTRPTVSGRSSTQPRRIEAAIATWTTSGHAGW